MKGADFAEDAVDAVRAALTPQAESWPRSRCSSPATLIRDLAGKLVDGMSKKRTTKKARRKPASKGETAPVKHSETETAE